MTAPKIYYARDILITDDIPIFATSIAPIMYAGKGANVEGEKCRDGGKVAEVSAVCSDSTVWTESCQELRIILL